jgi:hypothetical protein
MCYIRIKTKPANPTMAGYPETNNAMATGFEDKLVFFTKIKKVLN